MRDAVLKMEHLNVGSDVQNIRTEDDRSENDTTTYKYLGTIFTNTGKMHRIIIK
jgi:hypothetical protein